MVLIWKLNKAGEPKLLHTTTKQNFTKQLTSQNLTITVKNLHAFSKYPNVPRTVV